MRGTHFGTAFYILTTNIQPASLVSSTVMFAWFSWGCLGKHPHKPLCPSRHSGIPGFPGPKSSPCSEQRHPKVSGPRGCQQVLTVLCTNRGMAYLFVGIKGKHFTCWNTLRRSEYQAVSRTHLERNKFLSTGQTSCLP